MNKKAVFGAKGFALLTVFMMLAITLNVLIDPFKEQLDNNRGAETLNCPNTPDFNETAYNQQDTSEQLIKRPTCFVTGISLVWFYGAVVIASTIWLFRNWNGRTS